MIRPRLADHCCLAYLAVVGAATVVCRSNVPTWRADAALHLGWILGILGFLAVARRAPASGPVAVALALYPIGCYAYAWDELGRLLPMLYGSYRATPLILALDRAVFGVPPTSWIWRLYRPALDEVMCFFYSSYYAVPLVGLVALATRGQRVVSAGLGIVCLTYFTNFAIFYLLPALEPRSALPPIPGPDYTGYLFGPITRFFERLGGIQGGCFPSSHVSGATAWCLAVLRYRRRTGVFLIPLVLGIAVSTVYLRYHYGIDPLAGLVLGFAGSLVALRSLKLRREDPATG